MNAIDEHTSYSILALYGPSGWMTRHDECH